MSHEITIRENGFVEMAFTGSRNAIWHGLGNELEVGASIEKWQKSAGMDWEIKESEVFYTTENSEKRFDVKRFPGKKILYRDDTKSHLAVVGSNFNVVQPKQILEFFRDLVKNNGMQLTTAGTLFGGTKFWAQAELGKEFILPTGDKINGNLLLATAIDGSFATKAAFVSERVVCNNTLSFALNEDVRFVKRSHRKEFDPNSMKIDLGLVDEGWNKFKNNIEILAKNSINDIWAKNFIKKIISGSKEWDDNKTNNKKLETIFELYYHGTGSDLSKGSAYGLLNAFTEYATHGTGRKGASSQFDSSEFGEGAKLKTKVYSDLVEQFC